MKTKFLWLLLLCSPTILGQELRDSVYFEIPDVLKGSYNEIHQQPNFVEFTVLYNGPCQEKTIAQGGCRFPRKYEGHNPDFHTKYADKLGIKTSTNEDYCSTQSVNKVCADTWGILDQGHLASSLLFSHNREIQLRTFDYLNVALQNFQLNRQIISRLEEYIFKITTNVDIRIDLLFEKGKIRRLPTGATVPSGFKYTIKYKTENGSCEYLFEFDNKAKYNDFREGLVDENCFNKA